MKRPLVSVAVAFVLGELLADLVEDVTISMIFFILIVLIIMLIFVLKTKKLTRRTMLFLSGNIIACGIMTVSGMVMMNNQKEIYKKYENIKEGTLCIVEGKVSEVITGEYHTQALVFVQKAQLSDGEVLPDEIFMLLDISKFPKLKLQTGNQISVLVEKTDFRQVRNEGNFDEKAYYYGKKIAFLASCQKINSNGKEDKICVFLQEIRTALCHNIDTVCNQKEASVIKAVLYGDKTQLDEDVEQLYSENGIGHILAISGLHMSLVGLSLYHLFRKKCSYVFSGVTAGILILLFGIMTGFGVSAKRAVYMLLLKVFADMCGRVYDMKSSIACSMLMLLFENPFYLYNVSFVLSYSSIITIGFICPEFLNFFKNLEILKYSEKQYKQEERKNGILNGIIETFLPGCLLWYVGLVPTAIFFYQIPTYSIFLNIIVIPLLSILFVSGLAASAVTFFCADIGIFVIGAAKIIVDCYIRLCETVQKLPNAVVIVGKPEKEQIFLFFLLLLQILLLMRFEKFQTGFRKKLNRIGIIGMLFLSLVIIYQRNLQDKLLLTMIDVGQGDSFLVRNTNGNTYLIDAGSSSISNVAEYQIVPYLKCNGIGKINYVFLSHSDSDHVNGVVEILEKNLLQIEHIVVAAKEEYLELYGQLADLAKKRNVEILYAEKGFLIKDKDLSFRVIAPKECEYKNVNSASMVLFMEYQKFTAYFTGDIDKEAEEKLLLDIKQADVLKIAHHGSDTSSGENFLNKINPKLSLISCGENNRYHHPHEKTLRLLKDRQIDIAVTALYGAVELLVEKNGNYQVFYTIKREMAK